MEMCEYCDKQFTLKKNLYAHQRNIHNAEPDINSPYRNTLRCGLCETCHSHYSDLRDHYIGVHKAEMFKEIKLFNSLEEFLLWKEGKEKDMKCSYVKYSGGKSSIRKNKTYYACHRSGPIKDTSKSLPRKAAKSQGSVKLGYSCPSTLELTEEDGKFEAILFIPHIGHECSLKHLNLSKAERAQIAGKIAEGISFSRILDDIRNDISTEGSLERIQLLSRQDLWNIRKEFSLNSDTQFHTNNDSASMDLWVNNVRSSDKDQLYTVQKINNACSNTNCELVCINCKICIHQFSCECRDFYLRCNMCKHIHAIYIMQREESNVPSSNEVVDDGVQETHLLLGECNHQMHKSNENNAEFKMKLDLIYAYVSNNTLSGEEAIKMRKALDVIVSLASKPVKAVPVNQGSLNRKVTKQIGFESTKKKRKCNPQKSVTKPSAQNKQTLQDVLLSGDNIDHVYCKKPRLFCDNLDI